MFLKLFSIWKGIVWNFNKNLFKSIMFLVCFGRMKLIINGEGKELECEKISDLLNKLNLKMDIVAVELNKNIVHRENFDNTKLNNNDKLEIVKVVGGG